MWGLVYRSEHSLFTLGWKLQLHNWVHSRTTLFIYKVFELSPEPNNRGFSLVQLYRQLHYSTSLDLRPSTNMEEAVFTTWTWSIGPWCVECANTHIFDFSDFEILHLNWRLLNLNLSVKIFRIF